MAPPQKPGMLDTVLSGASYIPFLGPVFGAIEGNRLQSDMHQYTEQFRKAGKPETDANMKDVRDWTDSLSLNEQRLLKNADPHLFRAAQVDSMSSAMDKGDYTEMAQHADALGLPPSDALNTIYADKGRAVFQNFYKDFSSKQDPTQPVSREDALLGASRYAATQKMSPMVQSAFIKNAAQAFQGLPSRKDVRANQLQQDQWASANYDLPLNQMAALNARRLAYGKSSDETGLDQLISSAPASIQHKLYQSYYKARSAALINFQKNRNMDQQQTKELAPDIAAEYTPGLASVADKVSANVSPTHPIDYNAVQAAIDKVPLASRSAASKFVWDRITKNMGAKDKHIANAMKEQQTEDTTEKMIASEIHTAVQNPLVVNGSKFAGNVHSALQATKAMLADPRRQNSKAYESVVAGLIIRALDQQAARQFLVQKFGASQSWVDQMSGLANKMKEGGIGLTPDTLKQMGTLLYGLALYQKDVAHQQIDPFLSSIDKSGLSPSRKERLKSLAGAPLRSVDSLVTPENTKLFGDNSPYLKNNTPVTGGAPPTQPTQGSVPQTPQAPPQAPEPAQGPPQVDLPQAQATPAPTPAPTAPQASPSQVQDGTVIQLGDGRRMRKTAEGWVPVQTGTAP